MRVYHNFELTNYNSYKIKASCKIAYFPENEDDIINFFLNNKNYILLGSGHNIIFSKNYYDTPVIIFNGNFSQINKIGPTRLEVEAGAMMWDVATVALENSLTGLEVFWDIPSTMGGAVVMNAGASGEEIKDVLSTVRYFDVSENTINEIYKEDILFEYRNSFFQKNTDKIIIKAWLELNKGNQKLIHEKMNNIKAQRWAKQPKEYPNGGSVFKRPAGYYVGSIIDELGLKGTAIGGAKISEKHGGFIINTGNATGKNIIDLIQLIQNKVKENFGIELEVEQRII